MSYQLTLVNNTSRGRKKRIGSIMRLSDGRIGTFAGYCPNQDCLSKICMDFETAREFSKRYNRKRKKPINRMLLALLNRLETATR